MESDIDKFQIGSCDLSPMAISEYDMPRPLFEVRLTRRDETGRDKEMRSSTQISSNLSIGVEPSKG
jgi:hypothetical protein